MSESSVAFGMWVIGESILDQRKFVAESNGDNTLRVILTELCDSLSHEELQRVVEAHNKAIRSLCQ